jgi:hypothetical protein
MPIPTAGSVVTEQGGLATMEQVAQVPAATKAAKQDFVPTHADGNGGHATVVTPILTMELIEQEGGRHGAFLSHSGEFRKAFQDYGMAEAFCKRSPVPHTIGRIPTLAEIMAEHAATDTMAK